MLWGVVIVQAAIAFAAPSTLFGHWKDDRYKEKLEWDAFTHFLSDMAMIQKYAPADLSMWGDWLVYGTALGVGDKVEKAMKALNIRVADTGIPVGAIGMNYAFLPLIEFLTPKPWQFRWRRVWRRWRVWRWRRVWWRGSRREIIALPQVFPSHPGKLIVPERSIAGTSHEYINYKSVRTIC